MDALSVAQDILVKGKMNQGDKCARRQSVNAVGSCAHVSRLRAAARAVLRIILVTDLQSDRCDATDMGSDDAEFLQQARS